MLDARLVISSAFLSLGRLVLGVVGQFVFLIVLPHIVLGVEVELLALLERLEVLGPVLNDVRRLVSEPILAGTRPKANACPTGLSLLWLLLQRN